MVKLIDGKKHSLDIRNELREKVLAFEALKARKIGLAVILVGDNPASQVYVKNKIKACEEVGFQSFSYHLPADSTQMQVEELVRSVCEDSAIDGVLVQLPLPKGLNEDAVLSLIPYEKDVDGFCEKNVGLLLLDKECSVACTPNGVMQMLKREGIETKGKRAVVIGRSAIVGKPMAMLLLNADATVTVCHSKTQNLKEICREADILVAAIGRAKFVTEDMVKDGAVVIDVGINRDENGKLCGDVDFERVKDKCSYITPVPGGVGPMTITMLLSNTYQAAVKRG